MARPTFGAPVIYVAWEKLLIVLKIVINLGFGPPKSLAFLTKKKLDRFVAAVPLSIFDQVRSFRI